MEQPFRISHLVNEALTELNPAVVILLSAFLAPVMALIMRYNWTTEAKAIVALVLTCAIGFVIAWLSGVRGFEGIAVTMAAVYGLSQVVYRGIWRPTGAAEIIEKKTG